MNLVARWIVRASFVVLALTAVTMLIVMAVKGYWAIFVPFFVIVSVWMWWIRTRPPDFRRG